MSAILVPQADILRRGAGISQVSGLLHWNRADTGTKHGGARQFTAANSEKFDIADNAALSVSDQSFFIACHLKFDTVSGVEGIVSKWNSGLDTDIEYSLAFNNAWNRIVFQVGDGVARYSRTANTFGVPPAGTWLFVVAWLDETADKLKICINDGTVDELAHTAGVLDGSATFQIGNTITAGGQYMDGEISRVMFKKDHIITAAEITWLYNKGNGRTGAEINSHATLGPINGTDTEFWSLSESPGEDAFSFSGSNDLTQNNSPGSADGPAESVAQDLTANENSGNLTSFANPDTAWKTDSAKDTLATALKNSKDNTGGGLLYNYDRDVMTYDKEGQNHGEATNFADFAAARRVIDLDNTLNPAATDSSGNDNHGLLVGYAADGSDGRDADVPSGATGTGLRLNGSSQYVNCGSDASLDPSVTDAFTTSAWVKIDTDSQAHIIAGRWGTAGSVSHLISISATTRLVNLLINGVTAATSDTALVVGQWHHIVGVNDPADKARIYIDGVEDKVSVSTYAALNSPTHPYRVGYEDSGPTCLSGDLDDVREYNRALTTDEITYLNEDHTGTPSVPGDDPGTANLQLHLKFDEQNTRNGFFSDLRGVAYDANDDAILVPASDKWNFGQTGAFSIEMMFKVNGVGGGVEMLISTYDGVDGWQLYLTSLTQFLFWSNASMTVNVPALDTDQWVHIAVTRPASDTAPTFYLNGVSQGQLSSNQDINNDGNKLAIGANPDESHGFDGIIAFAKIRNIEISAAQVFSEATGTAVANGLIASWDFKDDSYEWPRIEDVPSGATGKALWLNGTDQYAETVLTDIVSSDCTISGWWYCRPDGTNHVLIGDGWSAAGFHIRIKTDNKIRAIMIHDGGNNVAADSDAVIAEGWHHIAFTWDFGTETLKLYIDGAEQGAAVTLGSPSVYTATTPVRIAACSQSGNENYGFTIADDVRHYDVELSADNITFLFNEHTGGGGGTDPGTDNLQSHWQCDESNTRTGGTFADMGSLQFSDTNDHVDCGQRVSSITNAMTIEAWIRRDSDTGASYDAILCCRTNAVDGFTLARDGATEDIFWQFDNTNLHGDGVVITIGEWQHVAVTYDGTDLKSYRNGVLVATQSNPGLSLTVTGSDLLTIADQNNGTTASNVGWPGLLAEIKYRDVALTAAEIYSEATGTAVARGLVGHWPLNDGPQSPGSDQDPVIEWRSKEGDLHQHLQDTSAKRPMLRTGLNGVFGKRSIEFEGSELLKFGSALLQGRDDLTLFFVIEPVSLAAEQVFWGTSDEATATQYVCAGTDVAGKIFVEVKDGAPVYRVTGDTVLVINTRYLVMVRFTGSAIEIEVDCVAQSLAESGSFNDFSGMVGLDNETFGALVHTSETLHYTGHLAERAIYDHALNARDTTRVSSSLKARYGLSK